MTKGAHKKPPRFPAAVFPFAEGSSTNETAAIAGGRIRIAIIVMRNFSSLAGLAATYSSKP